MLLLMKIQCTIKAQYTTFRPMPVSVANMKARVTKF